MHKTFIDNVVEIIKEDKLALGLLVAGSYITDEIDEYSDVDLILITSNKIAPNIIQMSKYAKKFGKLINYFIGDHIGENRVLICLYDNPLLHVDIKFITTDELFDRVENPVIVWERGNIISDIISTSDFKYPFTDYQWIEDRFWTWIHYASLKLGRGEIFEALDFTSFLRSKVISNLLHIKNNNLPRSLRKVEKYLKEEDFELLKSTIASYDKESICKSIEKMIEIYKNLRNDLFPKTIILRIETEKVSLEYFQKIKSL